MRVRALAGGRHRVRQDGPGSPRRRVRAPDRAGRGDQDCRGAPVLPRVLPSGPGPADKWYLPRSHLSLHRTWHARRTSPTTSSASATKPRRPSLTFASPRSPVVSPPHPRISSLSSPFFEAALIRASVNPQRRPSPQGFCGAAKGARASSVRSFLLTLERVDARRPCGKAQEREAFDGTR